MKKNIPLISVIMAAYNSEAFIEEAIYSIFNQTHKNLELIIVNDCSTDKTEEKILAIQDKRIKYFRNKMQIGAGNSRNIGLKKAEGDFVTIADSDDVCVPQRLEWQLSFLLQNNGIDIISGGMKMMGETDEKEVFFPASPEFIHCWLLFNNCLPNIVFFRRKLINQELFFYNDFWFAEDYYLWYKLSNKGIKFSTLQKALIHCRIHPNRITTTNLERRKSEMNLRLAERILERLQIIIPEDHFEIITNFIHTRIVVTEVEFNILKHFFENLYMENKRRKIYPAKYFSAVLYFYFLRLGKYYFLEKRKPLQFLKHFLGIVYMLGPESFAIFLKNNKGYR